MIICDTSGLVAAYSATDRRSRQVADLLGAEPGQLILSPVVLAELDYLIQTRAGVRDELKVLAGVAGGVDSLASSITSISLRQQRKSSATRACTLA